MFIALAWTLPLYAFKTFAKWGSSPVSYWINPANSDVKSAAAETAIQTGANYWPTQSGASIAFNYRGTTTSAVQDNDGKNLVFFRNDPGAGGGAIATTYSWWNGSNILIDANII